MPNQINGVDVTPSQAAVFSVVQQYGPIADHALVPLAQHMLGVHQSSSGIRTRRAELTRKGLVTEVNIVARTGSGRKARVFEAV